jgi:hypothetical protein
VYESAYSGFVIIDGLFNLKREEGHCSFFSVLDLNAAIRYYRGMEPEYLFFFPVALRGIGQLCSSL